MSQPLILDQIARRCGVSKNTVSAILRKRPGYAATTVERVQAAADALGYRSNPMVSALMRGLRQARPGTMQGNLAFLLSGTKLPLRTDSFHHAVFEASRERAHTLGFDLDLISIDSRLSEPAGLDRMLKARGIEGVIVGTMAHGRKHLTLEWSRLSAVALGFSMIRPDLHRVATNQYHVMAIAFRALRHLGYRRIGVCLNPEHDARFDFAWQAGLSTVQAKLPGANRVPPLVSDGFNAASFTEWFRHHQPDVVVVAASHDVKPYLDQLGLRIPQDVGLVHLAGNHSPHSMATVARDWSGLGTAAIDLLAAMLLRNEKGIPTKPTRTLINGTWSPGYSVRKMGLRTSA